MVVLKDDMPIGNLLAIDTDLMVAERLMGYDPQTGHPISDLVKVDKIMFVEKGMAEGLADLIPDEFEIIKDEKPKGEQE